MLNQALERALQCAPHDVLVVLITDFFGVDEQTGRLTMQLAAHNDVLGILVHDPIRLDPVGQRISVSDGALQMEVDLSDRRVREQISGDYRKEQEQIMHFLRRLSAPLLMISNQGDVVEQMRRLLGVPGRGA
jgi:hypothetical protein